MMGKYAISHHDPDMNEEGDSVFLLQAIANELAEANRLMRLVIKLNHNPENRSWAEELEDQA